MPNYKIESLPLEIIQPNQNKITKAVIYMDDFTLGFVFGFVSVGFLLGLVTWLNWWIFPVLITAGLFGWAWRKVGKSYES